MRISLLCAAVAPCLAAAAFAQPAMPTAKAVFHDAQQKQVGGATLTQTPSGVLIDVQLTGMTGGVHAFHVHEVGRCDAPSFDSAGAHHAPRRHAHGWLAPKGAHAGDMPNQLAWRDGALSFQVLNPNVTLTGGDAPLLDGDGSALVLHAKGDDYKSQPSGDAGARVACAVIERGGASTTTR